MASQLVIDIFWARIHRFANERKCKIIGSGGMDVRNINLQFSDLMKKLKNLEDYHDWMVWHIIEIFRQAEITCETGDPAAQYPEEE